MKCEKCPLARSVLPCPGLGCEQPSVARMVVNYVADTAVHVAHGMPAASEAEVARRLDICRACEHFEPAAETCRKCGCPMNRKAHRALSHCPLSPPKWG